MAQACVCGEQGGLVLWKSRGDAVCRPTMLQARQVEDVEHHDEESDEGKAEYRSVEYTGRKRHCDELEFALV